MKGLIGYLAELKVGKAALWCYLIWYLVTLSFHFDPAPAIWINSIGMSAVIGTGLVFSVASQTAKLRSWQTLRLYLMPFCVSSFAALIKGKGFIVVVSPDLRETFVAIACCIAFLSVVMAVKFMKRRSLLTP
ncbi:hypothetical protein [Leptolyngbya sp. GGD]|uniref:hypothetical protein n=1 Tax=Leptolyngbya sp. GGD TaxID=2997907 RepID=UPI00227A7E07|nr:hypothetical protein [Leptolyngbya sp. GGD]MCY6493022.1 hypothetical protein [Leptolyngbya sp. GGD]